MFQSVAGVDVMERVADPCYIRAHWVSKHWSTLTTLIENVHGGGSSASLPRLKSSKNTVFFLALNLASVLQRLWCAF